MTKKKWQKWHTKCKICGRTDIAYSGKGLCTSCYRKKRYKTRPDVRRYYKMKTNEWRLKHPRRWKKINQKALNKLKLKKAEKYFWENIAKNNEDFVGLERYLKDYEYLEDLINK